MDGFDGFMSQKRSKERIKTELNPEEIRQHLRDLWAWDRELLTYLFPMLKHGAREGVEYPTGT